MERIVAAKHEFDHPKCEDTAPQYTPPVLRARRVLIDSNILALGLVKSDPNLCVACSPGPTVLVIFCRNHSGIGGQCQPWTKKL